VHLSCTVTPVDSEPHVAGGGFLFEFRHTEQEVKIAREERILDQSPASSFANTRTRSRIRSAGFVARPSSWIASSSAPRCTNTRRSS
jgi:hypothetical protein